VYDRLSRGGQTSEGRDAPNAAFGMSPESGYRRAHFVERSRET
jgi:hypothetical protein